MEESDTIIEAVDLRKVFRTSVRREGLLGGLTDVFKRDVREIAALDGVSFSVPAGEIVGYIGANGAGKSTTIKLLAGILKPTSGAARVAGRIPWKERKAHAMNIGVIFGHRTQLWWDIAVVEGLRLLGRIYNVRREDFRDRLGRFSEILGIGGLLRKPVRKLSLGERTRCELAATFLHDPKVVFLDEPTIGLDVNVKSRVRDFIREINGERGVTVVVTSHDLTDIGELCPRVIIIDSGKILFDGSQGKLKERYGKLRKIVLEFYERVDRRLFSGRFAADGSSVKWLDDSRVELTFNREEHSAASVMNRLLEGMPVKDLWLMEPDLTSIVKRIYRGER